MGNKVLESAVEVLEGKAGNYTAEYGENLVAKLTWKNHVIDAGTPVLVGFVLGDGEYLYVFEHEGVQFLIGSLISVSAPGLKEVRTDNIPSKAAWVLNGAFDGLGFVGQAVGTSVFSRGKTASSVSTPTSSWSTCSSWAPSGLPTSSPCCRPQCRQKFRTWGL